VLSSWGAICSAQITPRGTPKLTAGLRKIFDDAKWWKGGAVGSWQGAFQANLYTRFDDGDTALAVLDTHLKRAVNPNFSANFPGAADWEIDGNQGLAAAVGEMLLQSQTGEIELLPALPSAWPEGSVKGLRARGGFEVDLTWRNHRLTQASVRSLHGGTARLRYGGETRQIELPPGETRQWEPKEP
jgi:alpha-L-fucosidase 2